MAAPLALVTNTAAPKPVPKTDSRLLKLCRRYLFELQHLTELRAKLATARELAAAVLRDRPDDPAAASLWDRCWYAIPGSHLENGVEWTEEKLAELLAEIAETHARTEAGMRVRMQVWRTVPAADAADRMLDSIMADCRRKKRRV